MGNDILKCNKGLLFSQKSMNISDSRTAALKLALAPASRYNFYVELSYVNVCAKFY